MDFTKMDYADNTFDVVFGFFILHHLQDLALGGSELYRVLKSGGKAVFLENWSGNPLLMFIRTFILKNSVSLASLASPDEKPLDEERLKGLDIKFTRHKCSFPFFFFWGLVPNLFYLKCFDGFRNSRLAKLFTEFCYLLDKITGKLLPFIGKYSYFVVVEVSK
jgi:SAM-dependent methyltransferase